jgi:hypothetical protein
MLFFFTSSWETSIFEVEELFVISFGKLLGGCYKGLNPNWDLYDYVLWIELVYQSRT